MKRGGRIFSEMLRPSPQVLVQQKYWCKAGLDFETISFSTYRLQLGLDKHR